MKYFGTDGIRGIPGKELNDKFLTRLGNILPFIFKTNKILIGSDTRESKDEIIGNLINGLITTGVEIELCGILPTAALINYSKNCKCLGIMITASHNPYTDNGLKIINCGNKLTSEEEKLVEDTLDSDIFFKSSPGHIVVKNEAYKSYINLLKKHKPNCNLNNLKIVIDCANGSASNYAALIYADMLKEKNLILINDKPDGKNINKNCGSTHMDTLKSEVLKNKADLGFAFDGDGDRVLAVDSEGNSIEGDSLIYLLAIYLKQEHKLKANTVALSEMCNLGILQKFKDSNISVIQTPVGDKYINEVLVKNNLSLGGENSGHIIVKDYLNTGDGLLNSLLIINALIYFGKSLNSFYRTIKLYPNVLVNLKVKNKDYVLNNLILQNMIQDIKNDLDNNCKIILRASGTEDVIRLTVMAQDAFKVNTYIDNLSTLIKKLDCEV